MKTSQLTDNLLRRMSPADKAKLGKAGQTADEAQAAFIARSEKELQHQLANLLRQRGIWFECKAMHRKSTGTPGCPDFLFGFPTSNPNLAIFCAWEVKFGKGDLDPDQITARDAIIRNGGRWRLIRSVDEAREHLQELSK